MHSDLAIGPDRTSAAGVFGPVLDGGRITSYADLGTADLDAVGTLCLVASPEASALLADGLPRVDHLFLGAPDDAAGRDELVASLTASPELLPDELVRDGVLLVRLVPRAEADRGRTRRILRELEGLHLEPSGSRSWARRVASRLRG